MFRWIRVHGLGTGEVHTYVKVAGIREDGTWLIIRTGSFPDETITKIALDRIGAYTVGYEHVSPA